MEYLLNTFVKPKLMLCLGSVENSGCVYLNIGIHYNFDSLAQKHIGHQTLFLCVLVAVRLNFTIAFFSFLA